MVYQLLCFFFCQCTVFQISLHVNIQESSHTAHTHGCTVLCLDGSQIPEIQPLNCFFSVLCRFWDVISIAHSHFFHIGKGTVLHGNLFSLTYDLICHDTAAAVIVIFFFLFHQEINTVKRHSSVVTHNTATAIRVRKSCDDLVMTGFFHLRCVRIENTLIMRFMIFCKDFMTLRGRCIAIACTRILCHLNTALWRY